MASSENGNYFIVPNAVADDESLPGTEKLVLYSLLRYVNQEQKKAWPSHETIARKAGLKRRCVVDALKRLETKGVVKIDRKHGHTSTYEINTRALNSPVQEMHMCNTCTPPVQEMHTPCARDAHPPVQEMHTNNTNRTRLKNNTREQYERARENAPAARSAAKAFDFDSEFEAFWDAYPKPKHPDKTPGRMRYEVLRRKGVPADDLLNAAKNYAVAMRGTDPQYIKRCGTFLGPSDPWRDYLSTGSATEQREDPEAAYMRDLRRAGMLTADEYENWRKKRYEAKRV